MERMTWSLLSQKEVQHEWRNLASGDEWVVRGNPIFE
jgi:hypothetical protein